MPLSAHFVLCAGLLPSGTQRKKPKHIDVVAFRRTYFWEFRKFIFMFYNNRAKCGFQVDLFNKIYSYKMSSVNNFFIIARFSSTR